MTASDEGPSVAAHLLQRALGEAATTSPVMQLTTVRYLYWDGLPPWAIKHRRSFNLYFGERD